MAKAAAKTGAGPTALVAIEQYFPKEKRIIEDDLAYHILPSGRAFLWLTQFSPIRTWMINATDKDSPGMWSCMICRKRYIDEKIKDFSNQIEAVVNLGAGYDTRAYRLPDLSDIPVWELDQPETVKFKQARLNNMFGKIPSHVKLVAIDFDHEDLGTALKSHGYSMDRQTFFIWEAVTQYLTLEGIRTTFDFLAKAAHGSRLAFTYVRKDFLDGRDMHGWEKFYKKFVIKDKTWIFGMEPEAWPDFLKVYGWRVIEDIGYDELVEKYVKPTGRILASTPIERIVYAEKL
jgi:methyltransferase (TIGR00027 family)